MSISFLRPGEQTDERVALVALLSEKSMPKAHVSAIVEQVGSAVTLLQSIYNEGVEQRALLDPIPADVIERAVGEVESWSKLPYRVVTLFDEDYPSSLRDIHNRPPILFTEGDASLLDRTGVAVVGTRTATDLGKRRAAKLARDIGKHGFVIVSGLAAGIDTAAHIAALDNDVPTIAVLGNGLTRTYPKDNAALARRIVASGGALVSQFFPKTAPIAANFPQRNITMSGLAAATIVVEASLTSGARMQARAALLHGRSAFLLRSLVEQHEWAQLMVQAEHGPRAQMIESVDDVVRNLQPSVALPAFQFG
jgi:DNA processing protein